MLFTRKLRERIKNGDITTSIRIWKKPHVKTGSRYRLDEGYIEVTAIREIGFGDITDRLARESGFDGVVDLLKTAQHGSGRRVYFIRFRYLD